MATITATVRENLIGIYMGMFKTAPGADAVSEMVVMWEAGKNQKQIAAELAKKPGFTAEYPELQLPIEFADEVVAWLASEATSAGKTWATNWIIGKVNAGVSKSDIIVEAVLALRVATNTTDFGLAKDNLNNKVEVGVHYAVTKDQKDDSDEAIADVTSDDATVDEAIDAIDDQAANATGQIYNLTTAVDKITGTAGNDTINGAISGTSTYTALDTIDGGAGNDTLSISAINDFAQPGAVTVSNVETVNIAAAAKVGTFAADAAGNIDFSTTFAGVTALTIAGAATEVDFKAPTTAAVTVSGATAGVEVVGGASQSVTLSAQGGNLKLSGSTGAISVESTKQGANTVTIDGGAAVSVTAGMAATAGTTQGVINIGTTTKATGAITVSNTVSNAAGADSFGSAITVNGGTTVTVTQTATQAISTVDAAVNNTLTQGKVVVNGGASTSTVTVSQSAAATAANTKVAVAGVTEVNTLTFKAITNGQTLILNGLTFTATADMTAEEVANAFANLDNGARQGYATKGHYEGTWAADTFTSGAASGATVVFTGTSAGVRTDLADTGTGADPTVVVTADGKAAVAAAGKGAIVQGAVEIDAGTGTDAITTASVTGYATGSFVKSDALNTLTLAKNTTTSSMAVHNATATTLALTLDTLATGSTVNLDAGGTKYTTLNVTASGGNSTANITAAGVTSLTVAGDKTVNLTSSTFSALKNVSVTGSAGITLVANGATVESVSTAGTTGTSSITIDASKATFTGGAGKDTLTVNTATALTKAINLGGGDDTLVFGVAVTGSTAAVAGGDGTADTISMTTANAAALDGAVQSFYTGFERLTINDAAASETIDLANLGFTNYVTTTGSTGTLTLSNLASNGTVVLTTAPTTGYTVAIKDAATGTADVLNVTATNDATQAFGVLTAANVETVNLTSTDSGTTIDAVHTLTLTADKATTVTATGNAGLTLTMTGSTKVTSIDGSAMTGKLTVTSLNTTAATTIKGGSAADTLTAATGTTADVLIGGAGNDTLVANGGLNTLTGGAGSDTFVIKTASANVNSYATITDASKGDYITFTDVGTPMFKNAKVTLGDTAVFQDFANAAINTLAAGEVGWFQFGGNTYVVQEDVTNGTTFVNGSDLIVKLVGLVDLSTASFDGDQVEIRIG